MKHWTTLTKNNQASWFLLALKDNIEPINAYVKYNFNRFAHNLPITDVYPPIDIPVGYTHFWSNITGEIHPTDWSMNFHIEGDFLLFGNNLLISHPENLEFVDISEDFEPGGELFIDRCVRLQNLTAGFLGLTSLPQLPNAPDIEFLDFGGNYVTNPTDIDNCLIRLRTIATTHNGIIFLNQGTMASPTSASLAARNSLHADGWAININ